MARLIAVHHLLSFINHKNTLKDCLTLYISPQYWGSSKPGILLSLGQRQERSLDIDLTDFVQPFCKMTYSVLSLRQPFVLFICNKLRSSLSAKEHEF